MATAKTKPKPREGASPSTRFHVVGKEPPPSDGLDFGTLKTSTKAEAASDKPIIVLEGEALELAIQFVKYAPEYKRLGNFVGSKGTVKKQIAPHIRAAFFQHFAGRALDGATLLTTASGKQIKLTLKNQYAATCLALAPLIAAVPKAGPHFRVISQLKIEFDKIAAEKQQALATAVMTAARELGIEEGISVSKFVQPITGFHEQRTTLLSVAENIALDEIIPLTAFPQL